MKLAIMQPYFMPYIGYFQLIAAVDLFVVYDNIKYTKKGWINRNRFLQNGRDVTFSLPLKSGSDFLNVDERLLADNFDAAALLNQFKGAYARAPYFTETCKLLQQIMQCENKNLFEFLHHSIVKLCSHLEIKTKIQISSDIAIDHSLKSQDKVIAFCEKLGAASYINTIGGMELYSKETFRQKNIDLQFIKSKPFEYKQFNNVFVPWLSIIDVLMFNPIDVIQKLIHTNYELV